jgi:hypothetical protein
MNTEKIDDLTSKIDKLDHKLELLLQKGSNDEKLVSKRKELLKEYFELKNKQNERVL